MGEHRIEVSPERACGPGKPREAVVDALCSTLHEPIGVGEEAGSRVDVDRHGLVDGRAATPMGRPIGVLTNWAPCGPMMSGLRWPALAIVIRLVARSPVPTNGVEMAVIGDVEVSRTQLQDDLRSVAFEQICLNVELKPGHHRRRAQAFARHIADGKPEASVIDRDEAVPVAPMSTPAAPAT